MIDQLEINKNRYLGYKAEDLLNDSFFKKSIKAPTPITEAFWKNLIEESILSAEEFDIACHIISTLLRKDEGISNSEVSDLHNKILDSILKEKPQKGRGKYRLFRSPYVAAVICIALLSISITLFTKLNEDSDRGRSNIELMYSRSTPASEYQEVTIIHGAQEEIVIKEQEASIEYTEDGILKGYEPQTSREEETEEFNQLIVPLGKRSQLTLADGSKLWINAGTKLVYPTKFSKKEREIYVDGEIYIDVSPDKERPFIIKTKDMRVQVLGTSFVLKAYEEDSEQLLVLVSGLVSVKSKQQKEIKLYPNDKLLQTNEGVDVTSVNTDYYTSWKDDRYIYENEKLGDILDRLSRYYGQKVEYDNEVNNLRCSGRLNLKQDLVEIIKGLEAILPIQHVVQDRVIKVKKINI